MNRSCQWKHHFHIHCVHKIWENKLQYGIPCVPHITTHYRSKQEKYSRILPREKFQREEKKGNFPLIAMYTSVTDRSSKFCLKTKRSSLVSYYLVSHVSSRHTYNLIRIIFIPTGCPESDTQRRIMEQWVRDWQVINRHHVLSEADCFASLLFVSNFMTRRALSVRGKRALLTVKSHAPRGIHRSGANRWKTGERRTCVYTNALNAVLIEDT